MNDNFVTIEQFDGLGTRLNGLEKLCAACEADKRARLENVDKRQESQNGDIQRLYEKIDEIKAHMNKVIGASSAAMSVIGIVIVLIDKFWK